MHRLLVIVMLAFSAASILAVIPVAAAPVATNYFFGTWAWTDKPVADAVVNRTWMWGPEAYSDAFMEPYTDSPGDLRLVQYYDKSRMEITHPGDEAGIWYITNGLLVTELVSGQLQLGDNEFVDLEPANVNVVGDVDQDSPITYALLESLLDAAPAAVGDPASSRASVTNDGTLTTFIDNQTGSRGVTAAHFVQDTNHTIASPFWDFMNASGVTYGYSILFGQGDFTEGKLFDNSYYATGFPITEAYWTYAKVDGNVRDVLFQCFQRRCLTYTPSNDPGWQVEAGNVGQHYYRWRYGEATPPTFATPNVEITELWPGETFGKPGPVEEYITLRNNEPESVELGSWYLWDQQDDLRYEFDNISLAPGESLTIYSCGGAGAPGTIDIGHCDSWWDWGDYAQLFDPAGSLIDYQYVSSQ
ncbi:MAG TPA: lamin tail domain-containing protein [Thermomicrobiales bacterium]|nr:lamin tail domain-containing protein [Thermomicrobiales bacterium]